MKVHELNIHDKALSHYFTLDEKLDLNKLPFLLQVYNEHQELVHQVQLTRLPFHFNTRPLGIGCFYYKVLDNGMEVVQEGVIRIP